MSRQLKTAATGLSPGDDDRVRHLLEEARVQGFRTSEIEEAKLAVQKQDHVQRALSLLRCVRFVAVRLLGALCGTRFVYNVPCFWEGITSFFAPRDTASRHHLTVVNQG